MDLTDSLRGYVEKKLQPLGKLVKGDDDSSVVQVEIGRTTKHHKKGEVYRAEITVRIGKQKLYASEEGSDLYKAIDLVKDAIVRELKTSNTKLTDKKKAGGRTVKKMMKG